MFFESVCIVVFGSGCAQSIGVNSVDGAAGLHLRKYPCAGRYISEMRK